MLFTSEACNYGPRPVSRRDEVAVLGTDKEYSLFSPQDEHWTQIGEELAERGIGVDLFIFPSQTLDVATIGMWMSSFG